MIPCRGRLWRSVAFERMCWIMRAAKGSPYNLFIIIILLSEGARKAPLQLFNHICTVICGRPMAVPTRYQGCGQLYVCQRASGTCPYTEFFQLLSALFKHPFFTFFTFFPYEPFVPFVPLSMSRCIRKMLLHRIFTYRLKII